MPSLRPVSFPQNIATVPPGLVALKSYKISMVFSAHSPVRKIPTSAIK
jgi:hypothetical protein